MDALAALGDIAPAIQCHRVKADYDRGAADSFPAEITDSQTAWHGTLHGGGYCLDRGSGALTFLNNSSAGGYATRHTCHSYPGNAGLNKRVIRAMSI